jgi:hypothetical protein
MDTSVPKKQYPSVAISIQNRTRKVKPWLVAELQRASVSLSFLVSFMVVLKS